MEPVGAHWRRKRIDEELTIAAVGLGLVPPARLGQWLSQLDADRGVQPTPDPGIRLRSSAMALADVRALLGEG